MTSIIRVRSWTELHQRSAACPGPTTPGNGLHRLGGNLHELERHMLRNFRN